MSPALAHKLIANGYFLVHCIAAGVFFSFETDPNTPFLLWAIFTAHKVREKVKVW